jgi:hypothetical protein
MRWPIRLVLALVAVIAACSLEARDAYVLKVTALGGLLPNTRFQQLWLDELLLHNSGDAPATVTVLGASNGVDTSAALPLVIAPGRSTEQGGQGWPSGPAALYVLHLDVPPNVAAVSTLDPSLLNTAGMQPPFSVSLIGQVPFPVFGELIPAGQEQLLFNANVASPDQRLNLALYNAGDAPAEALVELLDACDDTVQTILTFTIPARTIQMFGVGPRPICPPGTIGMAAGTYLRITLDQPGFAVSTAIMNRSDLSIPLEVSSPAQLQ